MSSTLFYNQWMIWGIFMVSLGGLLGWGSIHADRNNEVHSSFGTQSVTVKSTYMLGTTAIFGALFVIESYRNLLVMSSTKGGWSHFFAGTVVVSAIIIFATVQTLAIRFATTLHSARILQAQGLLQCHKISTRHDNRGRYSPGYVAKRSAPTMESRGVAQALRVVVMDDAEQHQSGSAISTNGMSTEYFNVLIYAVSGDGCGEIKPAEGSRASTTVNDDYAQPESTNKIVRFPTSWHDNAHPVIEDSPVNYWPNPLSLHKPEVIT